MKKVSDECDKVDTWLTAEVSRNSKLAKTENPSLTVAMIAEQRLVCDLCL